MEPKKRKRVLESDEDIKKRLRRELELLESFVIKYKEVALLVIYNLPYRSIRNLCKVSSTIQEFCTAKLDDRFWRAMWIADSQILTNKERQLIDDTAELILTNEWTSQLDLFFPTLPQASQKSGFERDISQSNSIHVFARYEAMLNLGSILGRILRRLGSKLTPSSSLIPEIGSTEIYTILTHNFENGIVDGTAWWDKLKDDDYIILETTDGCTLVGVQQVFSVPSIEYRESLYPVFELTSALLELKKPTQLLQIMSEANDILFSYGIEPYIEMDPLGTRFLKDTFDEVINEKWPSSLQPYKSIEIEDIEKVQTKPDYKRLSVKDVVTHAHNTVIPSIRVQIIAVPSHLKKPISGYTGEGGLTAIRKSQAIILFDSFEQQRKPEPYESVLVKFSWRVPKGSDTFIEHSALLGTIDEWSHTIDGKKELPFRVMFLGSYSRDPTNENALGNLWVPRTSDFEVIFDDIKLRTFDIRHTIYTEKLESEYNVFPELRLEQHNLQQQRTLNLSVVDDEIGETITNERNLCLRTIFAERSMHQVIWDKRSKRPLCKHVFEQGELKRWLVEEKDPRNTQNLCPKRSCILKREGDTRANSL